MKSPIKLLAIIAAAVFVEEVAIMVLLSRFPLRSPWAENLLDATLLVVTLFPLLYFFMLRPMRRLLVRQAQFAERMELANRQFQEDFAERERIESALGASESKFRLLFEAANDCILMLDMEGRIVDINHTGYERLGYAKEEMLGQPIGQFDSPEFAADVPRRIAMLKSQGHAVFESAHVRKDGSVMPVEINTRIVELDGQPRFLSIIRDITERKRAEAALLTSAANLRAMLDNSPFLTWLKDQDGRFISVNKAMVDYFGMDDVRQLEGRPEADFLPAELVERYRAEDAEVMAMRRQKHTLERFSAGDVVRWMETYKMPIIDECGHVLGTAGFARDITERQLLQQHLSDSLHFNETILNKSPYGIAVYRDDGPCVMANDAYVRNVGGTLESVMAQNFRSIPSWVPGGILELALRALETGQDFKGDFEGETTFGKRVYLEYAISPIVIHGRPHLILITHDILDRVLLQESLVSSLRQIEEKEMAKTRFLAAAGHDLRQPLAAANLFVGALKLTAQTTEQETIIQRLEQSIGTFKGMLDALLDVSRLEAGVIKPEYVAIDVAALFAWLQQTFELPAQEKQLQFRLSFPLEAGLRVRGDLGLVQSVLMNLVSNAIKFTSRGGVLVSARQRGRDVLFQVWDTGMGIADEYLGRIFEEFYQVHNPQRDRTQGLGLGLSIAKRALSLMGGAIACRSQGGRGTVFEFHLPLAGHADAGMARPGHLDALDETELRALMSGRRFVLVEDDELVAQAMLGLLQAMGARVVRFRRPEEALLHSRLARSDHFIVDYMLGDTLSGIQLLNLLRQRLGGTVKAVLVTGETSSGFMREAEASGWMVLHKPVGIARLMEAFLAQERRDR